MSFTAFMRFMFYHFNYICAWSGLVHLSIDGQFCWQLLSADNRIFWMRCCVLRLRHQTVFNFNLKSALSFHLTFDCASKTGLLTILKWWPAHGPHSTGWFAGNTYHQLQWSQYWWPHSWNWHRPAVIIRHGLPIRVSPSSENGHTGALSLPYFSYWFQSFGFPLSQLPGMPESNHFFKSHWFDVLCFLF